jgi:transcriptional regulator with XRE-family HTH domain
MKPQTERLIFVLRSAIRAVGLTFKEVEKRLNVSGGYLTRLFAGQMPIRVDQITEIAEAAGLDPEEIFRLAFPPLQKPVTPETELIRRAVGSLRPEESPESQRNEESASMLGKEVERLIERLVDKKLSERVG